MSTSGPGSTPYGGHAGPVLSVAVSPGGTTVASGGSDGMIQLPP
jgi:WD40 repeat protein